MKPIYNFANYKNMKFKISFGLAFLFIFNISFSQSSVDSLMRLGNKFYKQKDFDKAASLWEQGALLVENKLSKNTNYSYAASAYASAKDSTNSFRCLELAVYKLGFNDLPSLKNDNSYEFMKSSNRWKKIIKFIKPTYTTDPNKLKIIDIDVRNFWKAYDLVEKDSLNAEKIYMDNYINKGTMALQYYYINKIYNINNFVYMHNIRKRYYATIRKNTLKAGQLKSIYQKSFVKLKQIYPQAIFPPVYFVIGKLRSAGTTSSEGLILGIDQAVMSPSADTTELSHWEKANISTFENLPYTVAHELIHFQQDGMASDTTLLKGAILEGMADFIGELISGKSANESLLIYGKGKEKEIWADFKKEMYLNRAYNWIGNGEQKDFDKPSDLGYWVGYQICKAYYEQAKDKKKAIYEMLHIKDYKKFLEQSKLDEKLR
ncbi:MAG: hypothetical protein EAZ16_07815 [Sphingobacteriales bacterium]|nr:MAG: hypothetical protein EAZ16_07815 [Sphingobacteriales bacterium]